jgi:hypothetical protein
MYQVTTTKHQYVLPKFKRMEHIHRETVDLRCQTIARLFYEKEMLLIWINADHVGVKYVVLKELDEEIILCRRSHIFCCGAHSSFL